MNKLAWTSVRSHCAMPLNICTFTKSTIDCATIVTTGFLSIDYSNRKFSSRLHECAMCVWYYLSESIRSIAMDNWTICVGIFVEQCNGTWSHSIDIFVLFRLLLVLVLSFHMHIRPVIESFEFECVVRKHESTNCHSHIECGERWIETKWFGDVNTGRDICVRCVIQMKFRYVSIALANSSWKW